MSTSQSDGHGHGHEHKMKEVQVDRASKKIPVTVLTGFLGSGKTTLLNHILHDPNHGLKFAVIENEFGAVGVDDAILAAKDTPKGEEIVEMINGCICCTVRGDLIKVMKKLIAKKGTIDHVLIETTGMADPAPVVQTFFMDDELAKHYELDGVITVVDSKHILQHLREQRENGTVNESVQQVAFADRILLNKTDLVDATELAEVKREVRAINTLATTIVSSFSKVDPNLLIGIGCFDISKVLESNPNFLGADESSSEEEEVEDDDCDESGGCCDAEGNCSKRAKPSVDESGEECCDAEGNCSKKGGDQGMLGNLLATVGNAVFGGAAAVAGNAEADVGIIQEKKRAPKKKKEKKKKTVFSTHHDSSISSIGFQFDGPILENRLQGCIADLIEQKGDDLYRYKGVLSIAGMDQKFVFQGVHMVFTGMYTGTWGADEKRECKFVFIGKDLDHDVFTQSFEQTKFVTPLRFAVGDRVEANMDTYMPGTIVELWDGSSPYKIRMDDKDIGDVNAMDDIDDFVRKPTK